MSFGASSAGIAATAWIALVWYAARAFVAKPWRAPDRLRIAVLLSAGIPFGLGLAGLLFPAALAAVALLLAAVRVVRAGWREDAPRLGPADVAAVAVLVALIWPVAVRPLLDGDTLNYHLPNAASWVSAHGVWTTATRYWWYPPGSELAGAALWALAGPNAVGWAGVLPALLLLARLRACARDAGQPAAVGLALGCLVLATAAAREQLFSLQNDLWLTALFVEALATGTGRALLALIKPQGVAFALLAWAAEPSRRRYALWLAPFALWIVRDAILWRGAAVAPASSAYVGIWGTTIAGNLPQAAAVGLHALEAAGPCTMLGFALGVAALRGRYRFAALGASAVLLCIPFGFSNPLPQLASGQSLRFGLPLIGAGALAFASLPGIVPRVLALAAAIAVVADVRTWWATFDNDASTHGVALATALVAVTCGAVAWAVSTRWPRAALAYPLLVAALAAWCSRAVDGRASNYLADTYERGADAGGVFAWLGRSHGALVVLTAELPSGAVALVLPRSTRVGDIDPRDPCAEIRRLRATVVARPAPYLATCALTTIFDDGRIRVLAPSGASTALLHSAAARW